jgi:predicted ArsR family transcriptional regulator
MPRELPKYKRDAIKARINEGKKDLLDIADEMSVSDQTVKNYSANLHKFGSVLPPSIRKKGRPPLMSQEMIEVSPLCILSANDSRA